jgi:hypothetical protein
VGRKVSQERAWCKAFGAIRRGLSAWTAGLIVAYMPLGRGAASGALSPPLYQILVVRIWGRFAFANAAPPRRLDAVTRPLVGSRNAHLRRRTLELRPWRAQAIVVSSVDRGAFHSQTCVVLRRLTGYTVRAEAVSGCNRGRSPTPRRREGGMSPAPNCGAWPRPAAAEAFCTRPRHHCPPRPSLSAAPIRSRRRHNAPNRRRLAAEAVLVRDRCKAARNEPPAAPPGHRGSGNGRP